MTDDKKNPEHLSSIVAGMLRKGLERTLAETVAEFPLSTPMHPSFAERLKPGERMLSFGPNPQPRIEPQRYVSPEHREYPSEEEREAALAMMQAYVGVDYGTLELTALSVMLVSAARADEECKKQILEQVSLLTGKNITDVSLDNGIHEAIVNVQITEEKPLDFIMMTVEIGPKPKDLEEKMMLITHMPPINDDTGEYVYAIAWGKKRAEEVLEKIALAKTLLKDGITKVEFTLPWESCAYRIDEDPDWNFPLVWPKSWDKEQNEEMGTDIFDIGDFLDAGELRLGLANPKSWRKWIEPSKDCSISHNTRMVITIGANGGGDDQEDVEVRVWFEDWLLEEDSGHEDEFASVYLSEKHIVDLADATGTLDHLWV